MTYKQIIDPVCFFQAGTARAFMAKRGMTTQEFLVLDKEKDILGFLRDGYEPFHLMGEAGVIEELECYVFG
jgi:hypothetical protein